LQFAEIAQPCGNWALSDTLGSDTLGYANKRDVTGEHNRA